MSLSSMDQYSKSIVWMKNKHVQNLHFQPSANGLNNSWEEQAFADDGAGPFGGFVWPPRSYTCSFCKREFRSAQALGGHMNVHRRERARLKQSLNPQNQLPCKSASDVSYPSQDHLKSDCVNETNLGASSSLFISQNQLLGSDCDEEMITHKRHKATTVSSMPFFVKPCSSSDRLEDLDLELRLGDPPKVK